MTKKVTIVLEFTYEPTREDVVEYLNECIENENLYYTVESVPHWYTDYEVE